MEDAGSGQLLFGTEKAGLFQQAPILETSVHFEISGLINRATVKQSFRNDTSEWVEGIYVFPLPETSAVNQMRMQIGDKIIEGKIHEKAKAKKIYLKAKAIGKKASLVEQERPNMFTNSVANIGPGETIVVEIQYLDTLSYEDGLFSLRFPMTITPRYIPGIPVDNNKSTEEEEPVATYEVIEGSGWATNTDIVQDASRITPYLNPRIPIPSNPANPVKITATIDAGLSLQSIDSAYHEVIISRIQNQYRLRLKEGRVSMDQDFALSWKPKLGDQPKDQPTRIICLGT
jgi:Ca-activated chloride channel family protein